MSSIEKGIVIETNLPTLTKFTGTYDSQLNANVEFIRKGIIVGRIDYKEKALFSLNLDLEKKIVILNTLEIDLDKEGLDFNKRKKQPLLKLKIDMRDFQNYVDSIDIKFLIFTLLFIIIWKFIN